MNVLCAGSGTGGPVVPLLAMIEELRRRHAIDTLLFLGEAGGIEETLTRHDAIPFQAFPAGKLRRYPSVRTLGLPAVLLKAFMQARHVIQSFQPDIFVSAGGFIAPPIAWACRSLKIPLLMHVQDSVPLLSDRLMRSSATRITVAWQHAFDQLPDRYKQKAVVTGNPYRAAFAQSSTKDPRTVLCMGGGGGARGINERIWALRHRLQESVRIVHITGKQSWPNDVQQEERYTPISFTSDMASIVQKAGIAVSRAGFSSLTELAVSQTPTILVPLPSSAAQQTNARIAQERGAAIVLSQDAPDDVWIDTIVGLVEDQEQQARMTSAFVELFPLQATQRVVDELLSTARMTMRS